jgi:hypothetical protein
MPALRLLCHPAGVMGLLACAFIAWLWHDAASPEELPPLGSELRVVASIPIQLDPVLPPEPKLKPSPREIAQLVAKLKPGMTRAEVEGLVGEAAQGDIQPPIIGGTRTTYKARTLVTLEFDATKPGHPLLGIRYQEPGF